MTEQAQKLAKGDAVTWESQAAGTRALKWGVVVAVVPAKVPVETVPGDATSQFAGRRKDESYVVLGRYRKPGGRAVTGYYWPWASQLKRVDLTLAPSWQKEPRAALEMVEVALSRTASETERTAARQALAGQGAAQCAGVPR